MVHPSAAEHYHRPLVIIQASSQSLEQLMYLNSPTQWFLFADAVVKEGRGSEVEDCQLHSVEQYVQHVAQNHLVSCLPGWMQSACAWRHVLRCYAGVRVAIACVIRNNNQWPCSVISTPVVTALLSIAPVAHQ